MNNLKPLCDEKKWTELVGIMARLRAENGCPWDREQNHQSLRRYLVEETYEVLDAIDSGSDEALADELGDLLLQVVFHAQIAAEQGRFTIDSVLDHINQKMIRRHPHVFAAEHAENAREVLQQWEQIKAAEKAENGQAQTAKKRIMQINENMPALLMAQKVQDKAARVGFDWPDIDGPWQKVQEELGELAAAKDQTAREDELGDCLFALVNLARFLAVDSEDALRHTVKKFIRRFDHIESRLAEQGRAWEQTSLEEMDALWDEAKAQENKIAE